MTVSGYSIYKMRWSKEQWSV